MRQRARKKDERSLSNNALDRADCWDGWFWSVSWDYCGEADVSSIQIASVFFGFLSIYVLTSLLFPECFE